MNRQDAQIVAALEEIGREWPADRSVVEAVLAGLAEQPAVVRRPAAVPRRLVALVARHPAVAAAVLAVLGLAVVLWGGGSSQSLYAQVQESLRRAKSLHVVFYAVVDGESQEIGNMWYLRDQGFRMELGDEVRIDNGTHAWWHTRGETTAYRSGSAGEAATMWDDMLDLRTLLGSHFERVPARDRAIDGVDCQCYVAKQSYQRQYAEGASGRISPPTAREVHRQQLPEGSERRTVRPVVYVAPGFEVRRVELEWLDGDDWRPLAIQEWKYGDEIAAELFKPSFGEQVRIVDVDEAFAEYLNLDHAVHVEERRGLIYAVHRVDRFAGGGLCLLTSVRGTDETLAKYPLMKRRLGPGRIMLEPTATNWEASPQGSGFFRIRLAWARNDGIDAQWWIVVPRDTPPTHFEVSPGRVKVQTGVTPGPFGPFADQFKDENGVIQQMYWDLELDVPRVAQSPSLAEIARRVYRDVARLEPVPVRRLDLGIEKDRFVGRSAAPEEVAADEFAEAVSEHARLWQRRDVDFQLEPREPSEWEQESGRGVGLEYSPLVNDDTLIRLAPQTNVTRLYLRGTKITDAGLEHLRGLTQLHKLDLAETQVTDAGIPTLSAIKSLKTLDVSDTRITEQGIAALRAALPEIRISATHLGVNDR